MQEHNKMTPEQIRRHRRRIEHLKRERARVRRNKIIAGIILLLIVVFLGSLGIKAIGKHLPKKKNSKTKVTETKKTDNNETDDSTESVTVSDTYKDLKTDGITVCIDPGHGGSDQGGVNGDVIESAEMLDLAKRVKENLEGYGVNVVLTRDDDSFLYLNPRAQMANDENASVFVSLHRDSGTADGGGDVEIFINKDATKDDEALGNALYKRLKKIKAMDTSKVKNGSMADEETNYVVFDGLNMPGCLINLGYTSSSDNNEAYESNKKKYATAISEGILNYLLKKQESGETTEETTEESIDVSDLE